MARVATIIGSATDAMGNLWDVRERRATKHGWMIYIGWLKGEPRGQGCGGAKAIITVELAQYLAATRPRDLDIPIGKTTIKRMRRELGLQWDWDAWWRDRSGDLQSMTLEQFCSKHGCSIGAASQHRAAKKEITHGR